MDAQSEKNKDRKRKSYSTKKTEKNEKSGPGDKPGRANVIKSDWKK